jgi:hypothetical protein
MFCIMMVLPAFGGATSRPRWPLPIGATRSMMRPGEVLGAAVALLEGQALVREQRRQVLEQDLALGVFGLAEVDLADLEQREVALAVLRRADLARDGVAGAQVEAADLARRDVDVVGAGEVGAVRRAQEAEAVLQDLQHAVAVDVLAALGVALEDREDDVLLARAGHVLEADAAAISISSCVDLVLRSVRFMPRLPSAPSASASAPAGAASPLSPPSAPSAGPGLAGCATASPTSAAAVAPFSAPLFGVLFGVLLSASCSASAAVASETFCCMA